MSNDEHAKVLGRWLDQPPGTTPPEELDQDVTEAVYALRPDLAPAPRVSVDDILASVTAGPFAPADVVAPSDLSSEGADVVPFPSPEESEEPADQERRRTSRSSAWRWVGGTSGMGLALVAAATLLAVLTPELQEPAPTAEFAPAARSRPASRSDLDSSVANDVQADSPAVQAPAQAPPPLVAASRSASAGAEANGPMVYDMDDNRVAAQPNTVIPEVAAGAGLGAGDVAATADGDAVAALLDDGSYDGVDDLGLGEVWTAEEADEAVAAPRSRPTEAQRKSSTSKVKEAEADPVAQAQERLAVGDRRGAADRFAQAVRPPANKTLSWAIEAANLYIALGARPAAEAVIRKGLALDGGKKRDRAELTDLLAQLEGADYRTPSPASEATSTEAESPDYSP